MSINPFPQLDPEVEGVRVAPTHPYGVLGYPDGQAPESTEGSWVSPQSLWARPRVEPVQAVRPRVPFGLRPLDDYLQGGIPSGGTVVVVGPAFAGKRTLACQFLATAVAGGHPAMAVVTDGDLTQWRQGVANLSSRVPEEKRGLACFLDVSTDVAPAGPGMQLFPEQLLASIAGACHALPSDRRRVVFDSFSTVQAMCGFPVAFSLLARFLAQMRREGATALVLLEGGAHTPMELQLVRRQADGAIEFRQFGGIPELQVTGLGLPTPSPWLQGRSETGPVQVPSR